MVQGRQAVALSPSSPSSCQHAPEHVKPLPCDLKSLRSSSGWARSFGTCCPAENGSAAPANFAYHAKALGAEAYVVSCVGADAAGDEILAELDRLDLSRQFVAVDPEHPTGTVSVAIDSAGKPNYVIHEGVAWDFLAPCAELHGLAQRADAVCFGSLAQRSPLSRTTIRDFLAAAQDDCLRVFNVNLRQHYYNADTVAVGLEAADVLKLSDEEFPVVAGLLGVEGGGEEILAALCRRYNSAVDRLDEGRRRIAVMDAGGQLASSGLSRQGGRHGGGGRQFHRRRRPRPS